MHCTGTTRRKYHSRCLCSVSLESSSAITVYPIVHALQSKQSDGINQKTVANWKKRASVADLPTGPKDTKSTVLSIEEEAIAIAYERRTLLPLDDCLYALQAAIRI